ncbi:hypothetical protein BV898_00384, partial [Hypsibius exemplaris]
YGTAHHLRNGYTGRVCKWSEANFLLTKNNITIPASTNSIGKSPIIFEDRLTKGGVAGPMETALLRTRGSDTSLDPPRSRTSSPTRCKQAVYWKTLNIGVVTVRTLKPKSHSVKVR